MSEETKKIWDRNEVIALISDWKLLPELWDIKSNVFRNRIKKQNALHKLASTFNTTVTEISRKLHNLRTQFHSEIRKVKKKNSGDGADDTYESTWEFFDLLKFITDKCEHRNPTTIDNMLEGPSEITKKEMPQFLQNNNYRWNPDEVLELINTVKEHSCLWDMNNKDYRNRAKKESAISYIASKFDVTAEHVKMKIHTLRTQYTNERRKLKKKELEKGVICTPSWQYYDSLHFMFNHNIDEHSPLNSTKVWIKYESDNDIDRKDEDEDDPIAADASNLTNIIMPSPQHSYTSDSLSLDSLKPKKMKLSLQHRTNSPQNSTINSSVVKHKDEYTSFGEYIASELRLLQDMRDVQCTLKNSILKCIIEANAAAHAAKRDS